MRLFKPTELLKAKYTRRWRGKDGRWQYEYAQEPKFGNRPSGETAGETMRRTAEMLVGTNLPESAYEDVPEPPKVNAKTRNLLNRAVNAALPGNYYDGIPIEDMQEALKLEGYVLLQEDGTKWSGMFLGSEGEAFLEMGKLSEGRMVNGLATYKPVSNSGLRMTWYKMGSGKYEIVKYIT